MTLKRWLAGATLVAVAAVGPAANAGPFDMLRAPRDERKSEERREKKADAEADYARFAVRDEDEIGKFVETVSYQPTLAPGEQLVPVPEPGLGGPSYVAPLPGPGYANFPPPGPALDGYGPASPVLEGYGPAGPIHPIGPEGFPLYPNVKVKDRDNIHPCAVPKIVQILDPCPADPCSSCGPRCVYVQICVPPGDCFKVEVDDHGREVKYDYGEYTVEVKSDDGRIVVDYDD